MSYVFILLAMVENESLKVAKLLSLFNLEEIPVTYVVFVLSYSLFFLLFFNHLIIMFIILLQGNIKSIPFCLFVFCYREMSNLFVFKLR